MRQGEVTVLLGRWRQGDALAFTELTPLVYDELRTVAGAYVRRGMGNGLQVTELVGQLFVELLQMQRVSLQDRRHFFVFSARVMRNILADQARAAKAEKRGAELEHIPLNAELGWVGPPTDPATLDLEAAMGELEEHYPETVRAVELRYFFGFTSQEAAEVLELSKATIDRQVRFALAWLNCRLHPKN
ncbi:MAG: RNA polymerase subunit sigma-70 [Acidobacteria bacterium]|nr:RNA polymerase subunit sigma-70 [Acidobacteriota bacterium]